MPLRPRGGGGAPGTTSWSSVYAQGQQLVAWLATVFSFHTGLPAGIEPPPPNQWPTKQSSFCHRSLFALQISQKDQNNQFQPHPPEVCRMSLSHTATMSKESCHPIKGAQSLCPALPQAFQNWWPEKKSLLPHQIKMEEETGLSKSPHFVSRFNTCSFTATSGKSEMDSPRVASGTLWVKNIMALEARSKQQEGWKCLCGS